MAATDGSANTQTKTFEITNTGSSKTFTYDDNGNLTSDGERTFAWDARDQLVSITEGSHLTQYSYDGWNRRVRAIETVDSVVTSDVRFVWAGGSVLEQRNDSNVVTNRFYPLGYTDGSTKRFYTVDHLGSVREVVDENADVITRYSYDPYGNVERVAGTVDSPVTFAGYFRSSHEDIELTRYRAYSSSMGRWTRRDPLGSTNDENPYGFVLGNPVKNTDKEGLETCTLKKSLLLFSVPIYLNKKEFVGPWYLGGSSEDPDGPDRKRNQWETGDPDNYFFSIGDTLECIWERKITSSEKWRRFFMDIYECKDCDSTWTKIGAHTKDWELAENRKQRMVKRVLVPIIFGAFIDPEEYCRQVGP